MSKITDDLDAVFQTKKSHSALEEFLASKSTPGIDGYRTWAKWQVGNVLRKAQAYFAGADYWPDMETAMLVTSEFVSPRAFDIFVKSMGCGLVVGYHKVVEPDVDWDVVFTKDCPWVDEAVGYMDQIANDHDAMEWLQRRAIDAASNIYRTMGIQDATDKQTLHVWDLWNGVLGSCGVSSFLLGVEVGTKWREEEVLTGILNATGWTPES